MFVPELLGSAISGVAGHPRIEFTGSWTRRADGLWSLPIRARLSVPESAWMSAETNWFVVFEPSSSSVTIFPARDGGIVSTFQHQSFNDEGASNSPWRLGNPCLQRQAAAFGRSSWCGQPDEIDEKIAWYLERLLLWIDAAATGELAVAGEPFELPAGPGQTGFPVIGFVNSKYDIEFWSARKGTWGWADLAKLPRAVATYAVTSFRDRNLKPIIDLKWGALVSSISPSTTALWIALEQLPVLAPWEFPRTWSALSSYLKSVGVGLEDVLIQAGADRRVRKKDNDPLILLFGFPISHIIGEAPSRYHWIAVDGVDLSNRRAQKNGFRASEKTRQLIDRSRATSTSALTWLRTANWEPEELRTRSGNDSVVSSQGVLLIGAGSLGSAVAENLVRMGITRMGVIDADRLDVGNLTRHALGLDAVGHNKAKALASALNLIMPDANAAAFESSFPPIDGDVADQLRAFDVIVDCTGSDAILDAMSEFEWGGEKLFVSLAMTWKAEGLLVFTASESAFPKIDAKERFSSVDVPPTDLQDARIEGVGCWHPVFPASAADVRLWSAVGSKAVGRAMRSPERRCEYFRQTEDGALERIDV
ncbi:ThiF family adenylyltransferase [Sinorhizobium meliloti]|uniref:ThiF family adenylyltransferase n=1 Tax=Rhizobium meliloti TaxID=382 RepID=UPI00299DA444|nr:thiamine biosynthesis protein ThiF [Sinorhizobium meliloti]MDW9997809.1 thiamine biosynthesis protein ThiF [Sinorhizobium meliloti]